MARELCARGAIRLANGRLRLRPRRIVGDKGYSSRSLRRDLRRKGMRLTIPRRRDQGRGGVFDREIYRQRNEVERLINRLKQYRRIATRYEKRAAMYAGMVTLACIMFWLRT